MRNKAVLPRRLGPADGASLVVANTIGVGIFTTPPIVACLVPDSALRLGLWFAGGLLAWVGATAYAELASRRPQAGGEYVYIREAYGPSLGFLTGWTSLVAGFSGAIAAAALASSSIIVNLVSPGGSQPDVMIVAVVIVLALAAVHIVGVTAGQRVQNGLTGLKILCLLLVTIAGFSAPGQVATISGAPDPAGLGWLAGMIPIMFSYSGWNAAAYLAEEIREPRRNLPRALLIGTAAVALLYLFVNLAFSFAMAGSALCRADNAAVAATGQVWGAAAERVISLITVIVLLSSISAMTMAGPRVYFAMARDDVFPRAMGRLHSRFRTPATAIAAQTAWTSLLILTGTFEELLAFTGFAVVAFAALAVSCVFVMRQRGEETPFRMLGYPATPALFVAAMVSMLAAVVIHDPIRAAAGIAVVLAGFPVYAWIRRTA